MLRGNKTQVVVFTSYSNEWYSDVRIIQIQGLSWVIFEVLTATILFMPKMFF
jgi:hypothetical protein